MSIKLDFDCGTVSGPALPLEAAPANDHSVNYQAASSVYSPAPLPQTPAMPSFAYPGGHVNPAAHWAPFPGPYSNPHYPAASLYAGMPFRQYGTHLYPPAFPSMGPYAAPAYEPRPAILFSQNPLHNAGAASAPELRPSSAPQGPATDNAGAADAHSVLPFQDFEPYY